MLKALSNTIESHVAAKLKTSPCVGEGTDESTDRSLEKHLVAVICFLTPSSEVKTTFLKCVKVPNCRAIALHKATKDIMEQYKIPDQKIVSFGSDGASVIAGEMEELVLY